MNCHDSLTHSVTMSEKSENREHHPALLRRPRLPSGKCLAPLNQPRAPTLNIDTLGRGVTDDQSVAESVSSSQTAAPPPTESFKEGDIDESVRTDYAEITNDPNTRFREATNLGTYAEGQSLVKPRKPHGPDPFPRRPPKQHPLVLKDILPVDDQRYYASSQFTFNDFLRRFSEEQDIPLQDARRVMLSRQNYNRLNRLLGRYFLTGQEAVHVAHLTLPDDMVSKQPAVPHHQLLIEMSLMVKEQISELLGVEMKTAVKRLHRRFPDSVPRAEIIVYEQDPAGKKRRHVLQTTEVQKADGDLHDLARRSLSHVQGKAPLYSDDENLISPSQLAVLDSLTSGGKKISFKAHFIDKLPDLQAIQQTLTHIDLSFNNFTAIPDDVYQLSQLLVLKARDNPIRQLSENIGNLTHLRTLVLSFCMLEDLPPGLFTLSELCQLDLSYNMLKTLSSDIKQLQQLRELNVEGNQLVGMPAGMLRLRTLKSVYLINNFMHSLLWAENSTSCAKQSTAEGLLSTDGIHQTLDRPRSAGASSEKCDLCDGPLPVCGYRLVMPVTELFGIRHLPVLFRCCSAFCLNQLKSPDADLINKLYGAQTLEEISDSFNAVDDSGANSDNISYVS